MPFPSLSSKITSRAVFALTRANLGNHYGFLTSFAKSHSFLFNFFRCTALASNFKSRLAVFSLDGKWDCVWLACSNTHTQFYPRFLAVVTIFNRNELFVSFITAHVCGRNWLLEKLKGKDEQPNRSQTDILRHYFSVESWAATSDQAWVGTSMFASCSQLAWSE